jgi:hypothetical protein
MERRTFMALVSGGLVAAPPSAEAQRAGKVFRIGLLDYSSSGPGRAAGRVAFRQRMRQPGYVEG